MAGQSASLPLLGCFVMRYIDQSMNLNVIRFYHTWRILLFFWLRCLQWVPSHDGVAPPLTPLSKPECIRGERTTRRQRNSARSINC